MKCCTGGGATCASVLLGGYAVNLARGCLAAPLCTGSEKLVVAHNWPFDAMHLRAQFARLGVEVPFHPRAGLCTMRAAGQAMPWARRSLIECCAAAGLPDRRWHTGLGDARGAADLLCHLLQHAPHLVEPDDDHRAATVRPGAPKSAKLPAICETFLRCWAELPHVPETAGLVLPQETEKLAGRRVCRGSGSVRRDSCAG